MIVDAMDDRVVIDRHVQLAIVGAGPVGLAPARELRCDVAVLVIESGGLVREQELEALNEGECIGLPYPLTETRTRIVGGSSAIWAGYCAPFDAHDFAPRDW